MFISVDPNDRRPVYQQIVDEVKTLLAKGALQEGAVLPPVRQLAADLEVNLNTVATAYRVLQGEGLLTVKHGSGVTVAARTIVATNKTELRKSLRGALTNMILAGLPLEEILRLVIAELRGLKAK